MLVAGPDYGLSLLLNSQSYADMEGIHLATGFKVR